METRGNRHLLDFGVDRLLLDVLVGRKFGAGTIFAGFFGNTDFPVSNENLPQLKAKSYFFFYKI
jgi:hypothetical protein